MIGECIVFATIISLSSVFVYFLLKELRDLFKDGNYTYIILIIAVFLLLIGGILMDLGI